MPCVELSYDVPPPSPGGIDTKICMLDTQLNETEEKCVAERDVGAICTVRKRCEGDMHC